MQIVPFPSVQIYSTNVLSINVKDIQNWLIGSKKANTTITYLGAKRQIPRSCYSLHYSGKDNNSYNLVLWITLYSFHWVTCYIKMIKIVSSLTSVINLIKFQFYLRQKCFTVVKNYEVYLPNIRTLNIHTKYYFHMKNTDLGSNNEILLYIYDHGQCVQLAFSWKSAF